MEKKKRGSNYTAAEKEILLELIKKYQNIIENKETNAYMILKKRETWDSVCQQYNAVAVSGFRTWQQLRHLYENLKQRSKKNIAIENRLQFYEKTKEVERKASLDKKEINRTGGGAYKSTLTEQDAQILAMIARQVQPLANPYDDAALYFGDMEGNTNTSPEVIVINTDVQLTSMSNINMAKNSKPHSVTSNIAGDMEGNIHLNQRQNACNAMQHDASELIINSNNNEDHHIPMSKINMAKNSKPHSVTSNIAGHMEGNIHLNQRQNACNAMQHDASELIINTNNNDDRHAAMANINMNKNNKPHTMTSNIAGRVKPKHSKSNIKEQYFKAKLRNAKLENRYLINKYKLEMQYLKLKLGKLKSLRKH